MEHIISHTESTANVTNLAFFERAFAGQEKEEEKKAELSCNQLIKNILFTNLKLLKLNEITSVLLF